MLTATNNALSNLIFSSVTDTVSVGGNKMTVKVDVGKTATITASKKVYTQKRVMFCYGALGVQTSGVGRLSRSHPRNALLR